MKKILFIINSLRCGGAEHLLIDILRSIDYSKYCVTLLCFVDDGAFLSDVPSCVNLICPFRMGTRWSNVRHFLLSSINCLEKWYCHRVISHIGHYDAIISFLEGFPVYIHSLVRHRSQRNISFIHTDIESFPDCIAQFKDKDAFAEAYNGMTRLVFVSNQAMESFKRAFPNILSPMEVLMNFIDLNRIQSLGDDYQVEKNSISVVTVGRLVPVKRIDLIPRIAAILKSRAREIRFFIVGDGSERPTIDQLIHDLHVESYVVMVGFKKNPFPYLKVADIYLSTSQTEGMPLSICEAMAFGKPIISTKNSGSVSILDESTGVLLDDASPIGFADEIEKLMDDEEQRNLMGNSARKKAMQFDKISYMNRFYELIR